MMIIIIIIIQPDEIDQKILAKERRLKRCRDKIK